MNIYYEDSYCQVTDIGIIIYKYYFPLATSRTILYNDIEKVTFQSCLNVRHKWGLSTHFLNNWFHYDPKRRGKEHFIAIHIKNRRFVPSLTPEDATKVFEILRALFTPKYEVALENVEKPKEEEEIEEANNKEMIAAKYDNQGNEELQEMPSELQLNPKKEQKAQKE